MQKIISKRERVIFYLACGVVIFSLLFNFAFSPLIKKNALLNRQITDTRVKLKKYLWLVSHKANIEKAEKNSAVGNTALTGSDAVVNTLSELENLTKEANIRIIDLRPEAARNLKLYKEVTIGLRTEGDLDGHIKFIYNLENSLAFLYIRKLDLNIKPGAQSLEGNFTIAQFLPQD